MHKNGVRRPAQEQAAESVARSGWVLCSHATSARRRARSSSLKALERCRSPLPTRNRTACALLQSFRAWDRGP
jgi:hypothetical protein